MRRSVVPPKNNRDVPIAVLHIKHVRTMYILTNMLYCCICSLVCVVVVVVVVIEGLMYDSTNEFLL